MIDTFENEVVVPVGRSSVSAHTHGRYCRRRSSQNKHRLTDYHSDSTLDRYSKRRRWRRRGLKEGGSSSSRCARRLLLPRVSSLRCDCPAHDRTASHRTARPISQQQPLHPSLCVCVCVLPCCDCLNFRFIQKLLSASSLPFSYRTATAAADVHLIRSHRTDGFIIINDEIEKEEEDDGAVAAIQ